MWQELGMDLDKHDEFLAPVPQLYHDLFLAQGNRPASMEYFDFVMSEVHGLRVKELVEFKQAGGFVAGTFCVYVPDELVLAAGGAVIGLCAGAQYPIPAAEKILPRSTCPLIKASLGFRLERICPYAQVSDFLVGETTCDGKKKMWEIMNDYGPTYVMELPQRKDEVDRELWQAEVRRFKDYVEGQSGRAITPDTLAGAIRLVNEKRRALQRLYDCRKHDPAPISGKDVLLISQLAFFDDPQRFVAQTINLCQELEGRIERGEGVVPAGTPRILVTGTPMPLPHWKLHHIIETSGAVVVCEETCTGTRYFETLVADDASTLDAQLEAVAGRAMQINCACFTPNDGRINDILRLVREYRADGVIYYNLQFCQTYSIEHYLVEKALQQAGVPVLHIESDFSEEDTAQLATRVQAFLEMLG
ncbi:MAG: 2-hydroxyacyl-CoA dehydratase [Clostridia bacterium]|nr:MAG: 2-hydroxyacyl-CoA dehydratase [Clostridia bacterium]